MNLKLKLENNKELFKNAPLYMDNLTLWNRVALIYHTKEQSNCRAKCENNIQLVKMLYSVKTNTIYSKDKYNDQYQ